MIDYQKLSRIWYAANALNQKLSSIPSTLWTEDFEKEVDTLVRVLTGEEEEVRPKLFEWSKQLGN